LTASGAGLPDRSIDMGAVARRAGLGDLVGPVLTSCLLALVDTEKWLCLTQKRADEIVAEAVQDRWGDFSQDIVEAHRRAMDLARRELFAPEKADHLDPLADPLKAHRKETPGKRPALPPDLQTDYLGFRLRSPFIACVPGVQDLQEEGLRESLAAAPIGAVFFGPVAEEDLDREAWKAFEALHQGVHAAGFKARPPLERYVDLLRSWKESVEVPVVAGLSAVSEKNWLALAFALEQAGADAIEIFLRSPEEGGPADPLRIISLVGAALKIPLAVRLTPGLSRLSENLEDLSNAGAKGVTLFQQPTGDVIHPDFLEPREEILLTGPEVFRLALPQLAKIALRPGTLPLSAAAAGPISASGDLLIALLSGAGAVYVVPDPENLRRLESTLRQWMEAKGFASLGEIRGALERGQPRLSVVK
jgi:dihydroorotate dehydrogenase (fumarate)